MKQNAELVAFLIFAIVIAFLGGCSKPAAQCCNPCDCKPCDCTACDCQFCGNSGR